MIFKNQLVLITGAGRGLGKELALAFAAQGARVILTDKDAPSSKDISHNKSYALDVTDIKAISEFKKKVHSECGRIDILINNAGVVFGGDFLSTPLEKHFKTYAVNLNGLTAMTHAFLDDLIESPQGVLINVASASSIIALPFATSYAASKWAVLGFSESLRAELKLKGHRVHVLAVSPSYVATGMFTGAKPFLFSKLLSPDFVARRTVKALQQKKEVLYLPFFVGLVPFLKAILPKQIFDWASRWMGVQQSMQDWKGHTL